MNTIELTAVCQKMAHKAYFLGALPCNHLPREIHQRPVMMVVNTEPSHMAGAHWLAIYITDEKQGYFFDSYGNPPSYSEFPETIQRFLDQHCIDVVHSTQQVQDPSSTACGHHCVFFLFNMQKGVSYQKFLKMYGDNLPRNDEKVYDFVNRVQPNVCNEHDMMCVQSCVCGCNM